MTILLKIILRDISIITQSVKIYIFERDILKEKLMYKNVSWDYF